MVSGLEKMAEACRKLRCQGRAKKLAHTDITDKLAEKLADVLADKLAG